MGLLKGKVALITGAASGIGLAIARELLHNDAKAVVLTDVNKEQGKKALKQLHEEFDPSRAIFIKLDTTNEEEFRDAFKSTNNAYGTVDIVVNNAGITMTQKDYVNLINVNLLGKLRGTILALEYLPEGGTILNISSVAALSQGFAPVYSASKAAVFSFSLNYGRELYYDKTKVKVVTLCPGYTDTELLRRYEPEDEYSMEHVKTANTIDKQTTKCVAKAAIYAVTKASSGTAWSITDGQLYKINQPDWRQMCEFIGNM